MTNTPERVQRMIDTLRRLADEIEQGKSRILESGFRVDEGESLRAGGPDTYIKEIHIDVRVLHMGEAK